MVTPEQIERFIAFAEAGAGSERDASFAELVGVLRGYGDGTVFRGGAGGASLHSFGSPAYSAGGGGPAGVGGQRVITVRHGDIIQVVGNEPVVVSGGGAGQASHFSVSTEARPQDFRFSTE